MRKTSKNFKKRWLVFLSLLLLGLFFHKPLLLAGCKLVLKSAIPQRDGRVVFYEKIQWEGGDIVLSGLQIKEAHFEAYIERIELKLCSDFFYFKPEITLVHPQLIFGAPSSSSTPPLPFLYRTRWIKPLWAIRDGVMQLPSTAQLYFSLFPKQEEDALGHLIVSDVPNLSQTPLISADLFRNENTLQVGFRLYKNALDHFLPITALIAPHVAREWDQAAGEIELEGLLCLDSDYAIRELHCHGVGKNIDLRGSKMGIDIRSEEIHGAFSYPVLETSGSFWNQLSVSLFIKKGFCYFSGPLLQQGFGFDGLEGELSFEPDQQPELFLSGTVLQQQEPMPFELHGKGGVYDDQTFWSELELNCQSMQGHCMQTQLSLCSDVEQDLTLHIKLENAAVEHLDFLRSFQALPGQCLEGEARAQATVLYHKGQWSKIEIEECQLHNIRWFFPEKKSTFFAAEMIADAAWEKDQRGWRLEDLHLQLTEGDYADAAWHCADLTTQCELQNGSIHSSHITGRIGDLKGELVLLSSEGHLKAQLHFLGEAKECLASLSKANPSASLFIDLYSEAQIDKGELQMATKGTIAGEPLQASARFTHLTSTLSEWLRGELPNLQFKEAHVQAEHLTEKSYEVFLPWLFPDVEMSGRLQCEASFFPSHLHVQCRGENIALAHPMLTLHCAHFGDQAAQFIYEFDQNKWRGEIPLTEAAFTYRQADLEFVNVEGVLKLEDQQVKSSSLYAECEGLALRGSLDLSLMTGQLAISTTQIAGNMQSLKALFAHFPSLPQINFPVEGNFSSGDKGFMLTSQTGNGKIDWSLKGSFEQLRFPINASTDLVNGQCEMQFDSKTKKLSIEKGEGTWRLSDGTPLTLQLSRFCFDVDKGVEFAVKIVDGRKELAHWEAAAQKSAKGWWEMAINMKSTHFCGMPLNITRCFLSESLKPLSFEMKPILRCQDLHVQAAFLQNAGFLPPQFSMQNLQQWQLEGTLQTQFSSEDVAKGFAFHAESRDLKVKGKTWPSFQVSGQKIGEKWLIEKLEAGHLSLKAAFLVDAQGLTFPQFEGSWDKAQIKGSGYLKAEQQQFSCAIESIKGDLSSLNLPKDLKGTYTAVAKMIGDYSQDSLRVNGEAHLLVDLQEPLPILGSSTRTVKFSYNPTTGLICSGLDIALRHRGNNQSLGHLMFAKASQLDDSQFALQQLQFSLAPAFLGLCIDAKMIPCSLQHLEWEGPLEGSGDLQLTQQGTLFTGALKAGRYGLNGKSLCFEQLQVRYEKDILNLRAKTEIEEQPLWAALQINLSKEPFGALKLLDHPKSEGLKVLFTTRSGKIGLESIQGSCYGLNCNLHKNLKRKLEAATVLSGDLKLDGNRFSALLPLAIRQGLERLKIGNGYEWQGDLTLWQERERGFHAYGTLSGSECELLGYRFRHLEGVVEAQPSFVSLSNVKIEDCAGNIHFRKIELSKQENWQLSIPQMIVHHLQPSLMRKVDGEPQAIKPFIIEDFTMKDIRGRLGDLSSSLEGSGRLSFVNQFKKESSIFDFPLEMIKKIGLDPGLLTPVQGQIEMELRGNKLCFMSLQNAFSEGNRAEFYLAPTPELSYIDLEGKMHIDLAMRQEVMIKITEPFTLTIRGTLDKPRYGLQY